MGMIEVITQTVVFLFALNPATASNPIPIGTGFVVQWPLPADSQKFIPLIVTAKHVIGDNQKVYARFSTKKGTSTTLVEYDLNKLKNDNDYWEHSDEGVDIAIFRTLNFDKVKYQAVPQNYIASKEIFKNENIQETNNVKFPGLLINFLGSNQNYPILKDGSIALIPNEKVPMKYNVGRKEIQTNQELIFLNAISIPGLSGSPVFLWPGPRLKGNSFNIGGGSAYLIGVMHGFYPAIPRDTIKVETSEAKVLFQENSGVAIIFPSYRILEIFAQDAFKKKMDELIK